MCGSIHRPSSLVSTQFVDICWIIITVHIEFPGSVNGSRKGGDFEFMCA